MVSLHFQPPCRRSLPCSDEHSQYCGLAQLADACNAAAAAAGPLHPGPPLRTEFRMLIPEPVVPKLIGHHGENVKALQADTGAAVRVGPPGNLPERLVTCSSTEPVDTFQVGGV